MIVSPHSWLPAWTPKAKWIGGFNGKDGKPVYTATAMVRKPLGVLMPVAPGQWLLSWLSEAEVAIRG